MKNKVKGFALWKPTTWLVALGIVGLLTLTLIPLYRMALYTAPWYDDYLFGRFVKSFLNEEYSLKSALQGAFYCARTQWYAWQGCYSCSFLNSLVPNVWRDDLYFLGPMFLITILTGSVFCLMWVLVRDVLKADRLSGLTLSAAVTATALMLICSAQMGFYWYVGGVVYVGMHSFFLLLTAGWVKLLCNSGVVTTVLLMIWTMAAAVVVGGANYVTALQGALLGVGLSVLGVLLKRKRVLYLLPSIIINLYCFYKSVSAPGNHVRSAALSDPGMGPLQAIGNSFVEAYQHLGEFTGLITVAIMIVLLPIICRLLKQTEFSFRYPGLILLFSFCFYATGFTPSLYALGNAGVDRTLNAVKITYQILLFLNLVYWLGWVKQRREQKQKDFLKVFNGGAPFLFYAAMGLVMFGIFALGSNPAGSYSSYGAYYWIHTGEANEFYKEYLARVETIKNGGDVVTVPPYRFRPWMLSIGDLSADPDNAANKAMAEWYGKAGIICIDETAE